MELRELDELLQAVASGEASVEDASVKLRTNPYTDLGFAKVDHHRGIRQGTSEVIYGAGKTPDQIAGIVVSMLDAGQERILITRLDAEDAVELERLLTEGLVFADEVDEGAGAGADAGADASEGVDVDTDAGAGAGTSEGVDTEAGADADAGADAGAGAGADAGADAAIEPGDVPVLPTFTYYDLPHLATIGEAPEPDGMGQVIVACGGTSDIGVAEEAALTAEMMGNEVVRLYDVGVAGLHRLLSHADELARARVVVAVAGMEGALPSVVGGLTSCPVIAVPTSVGYGASFNGLAALLAMLNSCASGVSVVNIDNGFGAGYQASLINHLR